MPNRLASETSPYLLQHADNPVDWYPWGEEAFARARAEDRPILLSVGYSSCHWCHVMAHESFEDEHTARLMNEWFVNIKVDREERPDVDSVYMAAVQALTGQGGWPMTVFLTPDLKPFYAGTYFPPADGHGRPGFPRVLEALHRAWVEEREKLLSAADGITDHLQAAARRLAGPGGAVGPDGPERAVRALAESYDAEWGGFGQAPKFPNPGILEFLLAHHARAGAAGNGPSALEMALTTLVRMTQGGLYDHLGGGFSRYSVDSRWLVPHFEKMLYDNAQLVRAYLHAFQLTRDEYFARIVRETLAYLEREMLDPEGGFYSAQDADSEGIEGKYFVWTPGEVEAVLGPDAAVVCDWYGITERGNFRDPHHPEFGTRNVLSTWKDPEEVAQRHGMNVAELFAVIDRARPQLLAARQARVAPGLDDKVLASWNGLALAAFAEAGRVLREPRYVAIAGQNAAFVRARMWRDGRLLHTYKGGVARVDGMLEDYAYYGLGLVELYRATGDFSFARWAAELLEVILRDFPDVERGGFFETPADGEPLIVRPKPLFDAATPSGNGATAQLAWSLGRLFGRPEWERVAEDVVASVGELMVQAPTGFGACLQVVELLAAPRQELVVVGPAHGRAPLEAVAVEAFRPWLVLAPSGDGAGSPLFDGRAPAGDRAVAYFCEDMVCQLPVSDPEALRAQMAGR
jgi:uncharacterized protein YyaL (SSP411 family)